MGCGRDLAVGFVATGREFRALLVAVADGVDLEARVSASSAAVEAEQVSIVRYCLMSSHRLWDGGGGAGLGGIAL